MEDLEEDMTERITQIEDPAAVPLPRSIISRVKSSFICRYLLGALGLGMVAGGSAGGCMGAMAAEMAHLIRNAALSQTEFTKHLQYSLIDVLQDAQVFFYQCLLVATLSSVIGVIGGVQAYKLARRPSQGDASGKAFALAAPVAVLGVAVTGASLGAVLVIYFSKLCRFAYLFGRFLVFCLQYIFCVVSCPSDSCLVFYVAPLFALESICLIFYSHKEAVILADMTTMSRLISLSFFFGSADNCYELKFRRVTVKIPAIVITTFLIARSFLRDEHQPVPLLETAEATKSALFGLDRFFIIVFGVQMFQASFGAVLYSYFVTGGEGKVCASAVAAGVAILAVLQKASPMLGIFASLGGLLAVSGAAGVALTAAGDLGQRYAGCIGRAGAVVGVAVGAFLTLAARDVKFAVMVALCAAAFPGSPFVLLMLDLPYSYLVFLLFRPGCSSFWSLAIVVVFILVFVYYCF